jgi:thiol:disulfide interchange protein DsbC
MKTLFALLLSLVTLPALASSEALIEDRLKAVDPSIPITLIEPSDMSGFYEVLLGSGEVLYVSEDGQFILSGKAYQVTQDNRLINLTEKRLSGMRLEAVQQVDDNDMVIFPAEGERRARVYVFTDIDCPYCQKLHEEVDALNEAGVEVAYLAFPRSGPGGATASRMDQIWCADDRLAAMESALDGGSVTAAACQTPVLEQLALGQKLGVTGTPAMITETGDLLPGYMPAERLLPVLGIN